MSARLTIAVGRTGMAFGPGGEADQPTTVPSSDPIAIVAAIAKAPQKVTRITGRSIGALPAHAPSAPRTARKTSDAAETVHGKESP